MPGDKIYSRPPCPLGIPNQEHSCARLVRTNGHLEGAYCSYNWVAGYLLPLSLRGVLSPCEGAFVEWVPLTLRGSHWIWRGFLVNIGGLSMLCGPEGSRLSKCG